MNSSKWKKNINFRNIANYEVFYEVISSSINFIYLKSVSSGLKITLCVFFHTNFFLQIKLQFEKSIICRIWIKKAKINVFWSCPKGQCFVQGVKKEKKHLFKHTNRATTRKHIMVCTYMSIFSPMWSCKSSQDSRLDWLLKTT